MFENVDELSLCRPYVGIWALVVGRLNIFFLFDFVFINFIFIIGWYHVIIVIIQIIF